MIINNLKGITNKKEIGDYEEGVYMMKYNEVSIKKDLEKLIQKSLNEKLRI